MRCGALVAIVALLVGCTAPAAGPRPAAAPDSTATVERAFAWWQRVSPRDSLRYRVTGYVRHRHGVVVTIEPGLSPSANGGISVCFDCDKALCVPDQGEIQLIRWGMMVVTPPPTACAGGARR